MDTLAEIPLNNNDLNLAGLHLHESLPKWLNKNEKNSYKGFAIYNELMNPITTSDRLDYYTFFYQHWSLFSVTYQVKLQSVNIKLFAGTEPVIPSNDDDDKKPKNVNGRMLICRTHPSCPNSRGYITNSGTCVRCGRLFRRSIISMTVA
jgi:hypothetical protein